MIPRSRTKKIRCFRCGGLLRNLLFDPFCPWLILFNRNWSIIQYMDRMRVKLVMFDVLWFFMFFCLCVFYFLTVVTSKWNPIEPANRNRWREDMKVFGHCHSVWKHIHQLRPRRTGAVGRLQGFLPSESPPSNWLAVFFVAPHMVYAQKKTCLHLNKTRLKGSKK